MDSQQEPEAPESGKSADSKSKGTSATPSKAGTMQKVGRYLMLGFAPTVAMAALAVAGLAVSGNKSGEEQVDKNIATMKTIDASVAAAKSGMDKIQLGMLKEKTMQNEEFARQEEKIAKQEEVMTKIIQNVTRLQVKMKIRPTLEDQLAELDNVVPEKHAAEPTASHDSAPDAHRSSEVHKEPLNKPNRVYVAPHAVISSPNNAPEGSKETIEPNRVYVAPHDVISSPDNAPEVHKAPANTSKTDATEHKLSPQVKAMKEAIEQYNKH